MTWVINDPGIYTLRFSQREDGSAVDAFVFQLSNLPPPTGTGPPQSPTDIGIITTSLPLVKLGESFSQEFEAISPSPPFSWSVVSGTLPSGVDLSADGILSGTPTEADEFSFTVRATDSTGDFIEKEFVLEVLVTLPPPNIRIHTAGTVPVPGRTLDYFVVIENISDVQATDITIYAILEPWLTLNSAIPTPTTTGTLDGITFIEWGSLTLAPSEGKLVSYTAGLDATFPISSTVIQSVCTNLGGGNGSSDCINDCVMQNFQNLPTTIFNAVCLTILRNYCACKCDGGRETLCDLANIIPGICGEFDFTLSQNVSRLSSFISTNTGSLGATICVSRPESATGPIDPNEKVVIGEKFIQPDQLLVYPIHFENIGDVEALDVFVTDVLEPNLDDSTLEILTPDGASYDPTTRTLRWELIGRNLQPGETGNVLLSIKPVPNLPSGIEIRNKAEIQFEIFDPLITPEVVNIIDSTLPEGTMEPLPEETTTLNIPISWTGTDEIGEIDFYSIFCIS